MDGARVEPCTGWCADRRICTTYSTSENPIRKQSRNSDK